MARSGEGASSILRVKAAASGAAVIIGCIVASAARALAPASAAEVRLGGQERSRAGWLCGCSVGLVARGRRMPFDAIFDQSQLTSFLATNHAYTHIKIRDSIAHVTTACILSGVQQLVDFSANQFLRGHHQRPVHAG